MGYHVCGFESLLKIWVRE